MKHAVRASSKKPHLYSNRQLIALMLPLICEQIFTSFMGTVDSMMVSNVSEAAISAVSLVDSINILVIQAFYALASGGAIVCANYLGQKRRDQAERSANQLLFIIFAISLAVLAVCQLFRAPLLRLVFGSVEQEVMDAAMVYFFYTSLSFPFIALFDSGSAVFRAQNNSRLPMAITVSTNLMNIAGNALLIWGFHLGVAGAAISTLLSRIAAALLVLLFLRRKSGELRIGNFIFLKPDGRLIKNILRIGIPSGVENGMFQFGKLAIQSTVSTLGTTAIAAQAMTNIMENFNGIAGIINILCMTGWWAVYTSKDKKDMIWPDMIWVYILVYDVWNFAYTYNCLPTHSWFCGVALLLAPTIAALLWNKGGWIMNRANTLCIWCMFAQVFPLFQETFSDGTQVFPWATIPKLYADGTLNGITAGGSTNADPTMMTIVSLLALIVNIVAFIYIIRTARKKKKNPYKEEIFTDFKYYKDAAARAEIK